MRMLGYAILFAIGAAVPAMAAGCTAKTLQFSEDFAEPDPSWAPGEAGAFSDGRYLWTLKPGDYFQDYADNFVFSGNASICVTVKYPRGAKSPFGAGLLFWVDTKKNEAGYHNNYRAFVSPDGAAYVLRSYDSNLTRVTKAVPDPMIRTGDNAVNDIELRLNGMEGTLFVNEKQVLKFKGQPPKTYYAGLGGGAPETIPDPDFHIEFSGFRVTE